MGWERLQYEGHSCHRLMAEVRDHVSCSNKSFADGKGMKNLESFLIKAFRMFSDVTCEEETRLASLSKY